MTTDREHVAMIAAGMSDQELREALANEELCWSRMIQGVLADEQENREQARFQTSLERKRRG